MSVYVFDDPEGRKQVCYMIAEKPDELHAMAGRIGIRRSFFKEWPANNFPHYQITPSQALEALSRHAKPCDFNHAQKIIEDIKLIYWQLWNNDAEFKPDFSSKGYLS